MTSLHAGLLSEVCHTVACNKTISATIVWGIISANIEDGAHLDIASNDFSERAHAWSEGLL